ncbi:M14 family zinc carboxypeptidase [Halalkalicoccus tibetensis]|uniref:M14 family zinc carboxypeptidase n=1 Tax=Halalkalicoccus tibetensis TaxID=175632 RepID=A0ABD5V8B3_9EURY
MQRRTFLRSLGIATTAGLSAASVPVAGQPDGDDGYGPVDLDAGPYRTNEQVTEELKLLDRTSDRITLTEIGRSAGRNDPLWEVKLGEGDTSVHIIDQIHGDEPTGTEVSLLMIRQLSQGTSPETEEILENLSLTFIPRSNPDGAMYREDTTGDGHEQRVSRRQNTQPWCECDSRYEPYYNYGTPAGYDMNRDFNIDPGFDATPGVDDEADWWRAEETDDGGTEWYMDQPREGHVLRGSGLRLTEEVRAITDSFLRADPDVAISHHHQNVATVPDEDEESDPQRSLLSTMPVYGPAYEDQAPFADPDAPVADNVNPFIDAETSARSLRLNQLVGEALADQPWDAFDTVTRFGYFPIWGDYFDALCPLTDAAAMLYEVSGQSDQVGDESYGLYLEATRIGYMETFSALAEDPQLSDVDEEAYFETPLVGPSLEEVEDADRASLEGLGQVGGVALPR